MTALRVAAAIILASLAGTSFAQSPEGERAPRPDSASNAPVGGWCDALTGEKKEQCLRDERRKQQDQAARADRGTRGSCDALVGPDKVRCLRQGGTIEVQAQMDGGTPERGSIAPGESEDGGRPSEGAIKGGAILPGETAGVPSGGSTRPSEREINRCKELTGVLRDECLRDLGASGGSTRAPQGAPLPPVGRDPLTAPPLQNPR